MVDPIGRVRTDSIVPNYDDPETRSEENKPKAPSPAVDQFTGMTHTQMREYVEKGNPTADDLAAIKKAANNREVETGTLMKVWMWLKSLLGIRSNYQQLHDALSQKKPSNESNKISKNEDATWDEAIRSRQAEHNPAPVEATVEAARLEQQQKVDEAEHNPASVNPTVEAARLEQQQKVDEAATRAKIKRDPGKAIKRQQAEHNPASVDPTVKAARLEQQQKTTTEHDIQTLMSALHHPGNGETVAGAAWFTDTDGLPDGLLKKAIKNFGNTKYGKTRKPEDINHLKNLLDQAYPQFVEAAARKPEPVLAPVQRPEPADPTVIDWDSDD